MLLPAARTVVIPRWIYQALVRQRVDLSQLLNPDTVTPVLSRDDLAEWIYVNDDYHINKTRISNVTLRLLFKDDTSQMDYIRDRVKARLGVNDNTVTAGIPKCYETINVNDLTLVILDEEFERVLGDTDSLLDFIRQYLKAHCRVLTLLEVSQLPLHSLYIALL